MSGFDPNFKVTFVKCAEPPIVFRNIKGYDYLMPVRCPKCHLLGHNLPYVDYVPVQCNNCFKVGYISEQCHENRWLMMRKRH